MAKSAGRIGQAVNRVLDWRGRSETGDLLPVDIKIVLVTHAQMQSVSRGYIDHLLCVRGSAAASSAD